MAATKQATQVVWGGANTKTLSTNSWVISDEITLDDQDWEIMAYARGDNQGTPAAGDTVEIRALYTAGDVDNGGGSSDYPDLNTSGSTASQAELLGVLDTYANYDPDTFVRPVSGTSPTVKFAARAAQGATRNIILAMRIETRRGPMA